MTGAQSVVLAVGLLAPALGVAAVATRRASTPDGAVVAATAVATAAWVALLVMGARGRVAVFNVSPLVAAGAGGAALLAAAAFEGGRRDHRTAIGTLLGLVALSAGLAGGGRSDEVVVAGAVLAGLALAAALSADALPPAERRLAVPMALAGLGATVVGFVVLRAQGERWSLPPAGTVPRTAIVAILVGAAALTIAATTSGRRPAGVLLAGGLVLGLAAGPLRPDDGDLAALAIALAVAAVAAAVFGRAPTALALLALSTAAGPAALVPASRLLAAGSVVAGAVDRPVAWLAAAPGGVALAAGVVDAGDGLATGLGAAAALVAAALGTRVGGRAAGDPPAGGGARGWGPGLLPAAVVGAWLLLAPTTWTWTGAALRSYDRGMALAATAALVTVVSAVVLPRARRARFPSRDRPIPRRRP